MKLEQKLICDWKEDINADWWTSCGEGFVFSEVSKPSEHNFKFCCYCGGELIEHKYVEEQSQ